MKFVPRLSFLKQRQVRIPVFVVPNRLPTSIIQGDSNTSNIPQAAMLLGFPPVSDKNTSTLILGSMPGKDSLSAGQYYAHGRNAFWPIMAELFGALPEISYSNRLLILQQNGIGIWDVIRQCRRKTSLDSAIEEQSIEVNDFVIFLQNHPKISLICFNGAKAEQSFNRYVLPLIPEHQLNLVRLPSTSPANARINFQQKLKGWRNTLKMLSGDKNH